MGSYTGETEPVGTMWDRCLAFVLTYLHFDTLLLDTLFLRRWKPTLVLDQAAQIFDLTGVARVAVDDAGEPDS